MQSSLWLISTWFYTTNQCFITFSSDNFFFPKSFCHSAIYNVESTNAPLLTEQNFFFYIWVELNFMTVPSDNDFYQFIYVAKSFASSSLKLVPGEVGCDVSNTRWFGVLTELPFQTALQGMKFWTELVLNIFSWAGDRFLTKSTCPMLCNLASNFITSCISCGATSSFLNCWL